MLRRLPGSRSDRGIGSETQHRTPNSQFVSLLIGAIGAAPAANDLEMLYVVNSRSDDVTVIQVSDNRVIGNIKVGDHPSGITANRRGDRLYVAVEGEPALVAIDTTTTNRVLWRVPVSKAPHQISMSGDDRFVYVCIFSEDVLEVVDTEKRAVVGRIPVGLGPHNILTSADGRFAYSGQIHHQNIAVIDAKTHKRLCTIPMGEAVRPMALTRDGKRMYVQLSRHHGFVVLDLEKDEIVDRAIMPSHPGLAAISWPYTVVHGLGITRDEKFIVSASVGGAFVAIYTLPELRFVKIVPVGTDPNWIDFRLDGKTCYISNRGANSVSAIDISRWEKTARIPVTRAPQRILIVKLPERKF